MVEKAYNIQHLDRIRNFINQNKIENIEPFIEINENEGLVRLIVRGNENNIQIFMNELTSAIF